MTWRRVVALFLLLPAATPAVADLDWIRIADGGRSVLLARDSHSLLPWGFNDDHKGAGKLLQLSQKKRHQITGPINSFLANGVTAHRGNSSEFPENTMPAFQSGIDVGADWIELDILRSRDGQLVVIHDETTGRVGDINLVVSKSTYAELALVDVATAFRKRTGRTIEECPPLKIPLLRDVLQHVLTQHRTRVSIQPKTDCVADAVSLIQQMQAEDWVGFNDGNLGYMKQVKQLDAKIPVFWDRGPNADIDADIRTATNNGFEALVLHHTGITSEKIRKIKAADIEVGAWTVNDPAIMKQLLDAGVERLYTDHPRSLLSILTPQ